MKNSNIYKSTFKRFSKYIFILVLFEIIVFLILMYNYKTYEKKLLITHESELIESISSQLVISLNKVETDVDFLRNLIEDEYNQNKSNFQVDIQDKFFMFASAKQIYEQVRFLDTNGKETIRVNKKGNKFYNVPKPELQNKKNRYYFSNANKLSKDDIYISPMDLNIENGKIENPRKPMIRLATPLFDQNENRFGVLVMNYSADTLLSQIRQNTTQSMGDTYITNDKGYFFIGPNPESEWGFMYPDKQNQNLENLFPKIWDCINKHDTCTESNKLGISNHINIYFSKESKFNKVHFEDFTGENPLHNMIGKWSIISFVNNDEFNAYIYSDARKTILILLLMFLAFIPLLYILAKNITNKKIAVQTIIEKEAKLTQLNAEKDKFFSIIAHDLRSPLAGVLGLTEIFMEEVKETDNTDLVDMTSLLDNSVKKVYELLENLLEWSRMQRGLITLVPDKLLLNQWVDQNIALLSAKIESKKITVINNIQCDIIVEADAKMVDGVLRNLLSNAVKFTPTAGSIEVSGVKNGEEVIISFKDSGIGMSEDLQSKLFILSENTSRPGTDGESSSGLGLILSKEFIERSGGKLWVESEQNKGSTFYFSLPAWRD